MTRVDHSFVLQWTLCSVKWVFCTCMSKQLTYHLVFVYNFSIKKVIIEKYFYGTFNNVMFWKMKVKVQCDSWVDWAVKDSYVMFSINPLNYSLDDFICEKHCVVFFQLLFTKCKINHFHFSFLSDEWHRALLFDVWHLWLAVLCFTTNSIYRYCINTSSLYIGIHEKMFKLHMI